MKPDANTILDRELGRLGGFSARWVSWLLPSNVGERVLRHRCKPAVARQLVEAVLRELGPIEPEPFGGPDSISVVTGCGYGRLNPAMVTVTILEDDSGSEFQVRAVAREGLFKQRGGEQTAAEVADALARALAQA